MISSTASAGYSATVQLWLEHPDGVMALTQVGPQWVIPEHPEDLPRCKAVVVVEVDGRRYPRDVTLLEGMSASATFTRIGDAHRHHFHEPASK